jgi:hypothetical protein
MGRMGFQPNDAPTQPLQSATTPKSTSEDDVNFDALWDELLDLSSPEATDAYSAYTRRHRR